MTRCNRGGTRITSACCATRALAQRFPRRNPWTKRHGRLIGRPLGPVVLPLHADAPLREAIGEAADCRRCHLYASATQTVFGEGPGYAKVLFVGEQPGDQEDVIGRPFVGPAGQIMDRALEEAGIDRRTVYVTNAVKHFKFVPRGKRRIHQTPEAPEIQACRFWLDVELVRLRPKLVVALGGTAARTLLGRAVTIRRERGRPIEGARRPDGIRDRVPVLPSAGAR